MNCTDQEKKKKKKRIELERSDQRETVSHRHSRQREDWKEINDVDQPMDVERVESVHSDRPPIDIFLKRNEKIFLNNDDGNAIELTTTDFLLQ